MAFFNPFCSEEAISHSNYCTLQKADYKTSKPVEGHMKQATKTVASKLNALMADAKKPKQLFGSARKNNFGVYPELTTTEATAGLCRDLAQFMNEQRERKAGNATFMAVFTTPSTLTEEVFNNKVEEQIALLQKAAEPFYCLPESEKERQSEGSCISFGGRVLKVVSIYRNTSGGQLKFDYPMLAFSLKDEKEGQHKFINPKESRSAKVNDKINKVVSNYGTKRPKA